MIYWTDWLLVVGWIAGILLLVWLVNHGYIPM